LLNELEVNMAGVKEKLSTIEFTVEHLNDVKFEDFEKRFKKEILQDTRSQATKINENLEQLEKKADSQAKWNENLQKNLLDLKKKLDNEMLKVLDLKLVQENEAKWKKNETKLEELSTSLENIIKKTNQQGQEILAISGEVFDYSFYEGASSFDERVENRISTIKQNIQELQKAMEKVNKNSIQETTSDSLLQSVNKIIDNKLETMNSQVKDKIKQMNDLLNKEKKITEENVEKKIIYMAGNQVIEPEDVIQDSDGKLYLKKKAEKDNAIQRKFPERKTQKPRNQSQTFHKTKRRIYRASEPYKSSKHEYKRKDRRARFTNPELPRKRGYDDQFVGFQNFQQHHKLPLQSQFPIIHNNAPYPFPSIYNSHQIQPFHPLWFEKPTQQYPTQAGAWRWYQL